MTVWRYEAVLLESPAVASPVAQTARQERQRGELAASSEAEARAALRRIGLQALSVRPARRSPSINSPGTTPGTAPGTRPSNARMHDALHGLADAWQRRQRRRRRGARAQLFDSVGTMIRSGVPLLEAVETLAIARGRRGASAQRSMLAELREALRSGGSLAAAMRAQPGWFDPVEAAMVEAGQHGGTLPQVLQALAERHEEEGRLAGRLAGALLYPSIVAMAGIGVAVFLSVRTLPELVRILEGANVPVPTVTLWTMAAGQWTARWGWLGALVVAAVAVLGMPLASAAAGARGPAGRSWNAALARARARLTPGVIRTMAVADVSIRLGELVRAGVPVTEALRVLAPTTRPALGALLTDAAAKVERGEEFGASLCDGRWFDEEFRRLIEVAQASGELDSMLDRVGRRHEREARRLVDRVATLMEPAVIVLLAALVGTVVMAAVLPLARMKDVV